jgi:hypothetical protein
MSKPQKLNNRTHLRDHFIYYNLHKRCWSLKALQTVELNVNGVFAPSVKGRVTGHADTVLASRVTTKISEAGRQRVIREKRKNVHAGIVGEFCLVEPTYRFHTTDKTPSMSYNPYKAGHFYDRATGAIVTTAPHVLMRSGCDGGPPSVHYGDDLYYAYWERPDGSTNFAETVGFLTKSDLYYWIGLSEFTGFVRRVSRPYETYLRVKYGNVEFAD